MLMRIWSSGDQLRSSNRIKPRARLCEPWVIGALDLESREAATVRNKKPLAN